MAEYTNHAARPWHQFFADPPKLALAGKPIKLALFQISKKCPYACRYCYRSSEIDGQIVPYRIAGNIIDRLMNDGWKVFPLIAELVPEIEACLPYWQQCGANEISTAGDPLVEREAWFNILKRHNIDGLRITVFPTNDLHTAWTGRPRENAIRAIDMAVEKKFYVTWNFLLSRHTRPYLQSQVDEALRCGAHRFHINLFFPGGRGVSRRNEMLSVEELIDVRREYVALKDTYRMKILLTRNGLTGPSADERAISARLAKMGKFCLAGCGDHEQMMFIDADLKIYGCLTQIDSELCLGRISETGELQFNGKHPMAGFDRKDCFMVHYMRSRYR